MNGAYVITCTTPHDGTPHEPTTTNGGVSGWHGPDAHAAAKAESKAYPHAVVTIWQKQQVTGTEPCESCGRSNWPWSYRAIAVYMNGERLRTVTATLEAVTS